MRRRQQVMAILKNKELTKRMEEEAKQREDKVAAQIKLRTDAITQNALVAKKKKENVDELQTMRATEEQKRMQEEMEKIYTKLDQTSARHQDFIAERVQEAQKRNNSVNDTLLRTRERQEQ
jgi:hypothetical protein